jgi:hypothetical protein
MLKNLEFEIMWGLRELIREHGGVAVVVNTGAGQKLWRNLEALKALKARKATS